MGLDYRTHIGPFIECRTHKVQAIEQRRTCTNTECKEYRHTFWQKETKFCQVCGSPIDKVGFKVEKDNIQTHELQEALFETTHAERLTPVSGDSFHQWERDNDLHLWTPNVKYLGRRGSYNSKENIQFMEFDGGLIQAEIDTCKEFFAPELTFLRKHYGEDKVVVKWGLIHTIS